MATPEVPISIGNFSELAQFRSPTDYTINVVRGDSLTYIFRMFREVDCSGSGGGPQTLTGMTGRAVIRKTWDDPMLYTLTAVVDTDAGSGRVTVTATPAETRVLPDFGVWELELTNAGETIRKTVVMGSVEFTRDLVY